jgi:hypothetical protein
MGSFSFGHLQTVWSLLHKAALNRESRDDNKIVIVSPWHHNAARNEDGWSSSVLDAIYTNRSGGTESLSDILSELVSMGYEVTMVTLSQYGRNMSRGDNSVLDREKNFFEVLERSGIQCSLVDDIHHKYLRTPFDIIEGSMNLSKNGLFGKTRDTMTLISKARDPQIFNQNDSIIQDILSSSKSYYEKPSSVTEVSVAQYKINDISNYLDKMITKLPELKINIMIDETFAPNVPDDLEPIGQEPGESNEVSYTSTLIQANGLFETWVMNYIELLVNELFEDTQENSLAEKFSPFPVSNYEPKPSVIFERMLTALSEEKNIQTIKKKLFLFEEVAWDEWITNLESTIQLYIQTYANITTEGSDQREIRQKIVEIKKRLGELSLL